MSEEQGSQACRRSELDVLAGVSSALIAMCDTRDDDCVQPACSPYETVHEKRVGGAVDVAPSNPSFEPAPAQVGALSSSGVSMSSIGSSTIGPSPAPVVSKGSNMTPSWGSGASCSKETSKKGQAQSPDRAKNAMIYRERKMMKAQCRGEERVEAYVFFGDWIITDVGGGHRPHVDVAVRKVIRESAFKNVRRVGSRGKKGEEFYGAIVSFSDCKGRSVMKALEAPRFLKEVACVASVNSSESRKGNTFYCVMKSGSVGGMTVVKAESGRYYVVPSNVVSVPPGPDVHRHPLIGPTDTVAKKEGACSDL